MKLNILLKQTKSGFWYCEGTITLGGGSSCEIITNAWELPSRAIEEITEEIRKTGVEMIAQVNPWLEKLDEQGIKHHEVEMKATLV